jgi:hypothetical protein
MATPSVTNTFANSTTADATEVNANFADLVTFLTNSVVHVDGARAMTAALVLHASGITFPSLTIVDALDEDTLSSDSATAVATQQSIKAYVDAAAAAITIGSDTDTSTRTTTSDAYVALTGAPAVTITTGTTALAMWSAEMSNDTAGSSTHQCPAVSSATTVAATDQYATWYESSAASDATHQFHAHLFEGLTGGSNVFTINSRRGNAAGTSTLKRQNLYVVQWSA